MSFMIGKLCAVSGGDGVSSWGVEVLAESKTLWSNYVVSLLVKKSQSDFFKFYFYKVSENKELFCLPMSYMCDDMWCMYKYHICKRQYCNSAE